jgi:hypothetical protein
MIVRSVGLWFKNKQGKPHGLAGPMVTRAVASRLHFLGYVQAFQNSGSTGRRTLGPRKPFPGTGGFRGSGPLGR